MVKTRRSAATSSTGSPPRTPPRRGPTAAGAAAASAKEQPYSASTFAAPAESEKQFNMAKTPRHCNRVRRQSEDRYDNDGGDNDENLRVATDLDRRHYSDANRPSNSNLNSNPNLNSNLNSNLKPKPGVPPPPSLVIPTSPHRPSAGGVIHNAADGRPEPSYHPHHAPQYSGGGRHGHPPPPYHPHSHHGRGSSAGSMEYSPGRPPHPYEPSYPPPHYPDDLGEHYHYEYYHRPPLGSDPPHYYPPGRDRDGDRDRHPPRYSDPYHPPPPHPHHPHHDPYYSSPDEQERDRARRDPRDSHHRHPHHYDHRHVPPPPRHAVHPPPQNSHSRSRSQPHHGKHAIPKPHPYSHMYPTQERDAGHNEHTSSHDTHSSHENNSLRAVSSSFSEANKSQSQSQLSYDSSLDRGEGYRKDSMDTDNDADSRGNPPRRPLGHSMGGPAAPARATAETPLQTERETNGHKRHDETPGIGTAPSSDSPQSDSSWNQLKQIASVDKDEMLRAKEQIQRQEVHERQREQMAKDGDGKGKANKQSDQQTTTVRDVSVMKELVLPTPRRRGNSSKIDNNTDSNERKKGSHVQELESPEHDDLKVSISRTSSLSNSPGDDEYPHPHTHHPHHNPHSHHLPPDRPIYDHYERDHPHHHPQNVLPPPRHSKYHHHHHYMNINAEQSAMPPPPGHYPRHLHPHVPPHPYPPSYPSHTQAHHEHLHQHDHGGPPEHPQDIHHPYHARPPSHPYHGGMYPDEHSPSESTISTKVSLPGKFFPEKPSTSTAPATYPRDRMEDGGFHGEVAGTEAAAPPIGTMKPKHPVHLKTSRAGNFANGEDRKDNDRDASAAIDRSGMAATNAAAAAKSNPGAASGEESEDISPTSLVEPIAKRRKLTSETGDGATVETKVKEGSSRDDDKMDVVPAPVATREGAMATSTTAGGDGNTPTSAGFDPTDLSAMPSWDKNAGVFSSGLSICSGMTMESLNTRAVLSAFSFSSENRKALGGVLGGDVADDADAEDSPRNDDPAKEKKGEDAVMSRSQLDDNTANANVATTTTDPKQTTKSVPPKKSTQAAAASLPSSQPKSEKRPINKESSGAHHVHFSHPPPPARGSRHGSRGPPPPSHHDDHYYDTAPPMLPHVQSSSSYDYPHTPPRPVIHVPHSRSRHRDYPPHPYHEEMEPHSPYSYDYYGYPIPPNPYHPSYPPPSHRYGRGPPPPPPPADLGYPPRDPYGYPIKRHGHPPPYPPHEYSPEYPTSSAVTSSPGGPPSRGGPRRVYHPYPPHSAYPVGPPPPHMLNIPYLRGPGEHSMGASLPQNGWSKEDDSALMEIVKKFKNPKNWEPVARKLNRGKSAKECQERWLRFLKPGSRKGQWTDEEDQIVIEAVTNSLEDPFTRWSDLAQKLPGRVGKQVRDRWVNHLNPNINHNPFSEEDDHLLWKGHNALGKRWVEISTKFFNSTRSENHIKNRWYSAAFKKFICSEYGPTAYKEATQAYEKEKGSTTGGSVSDTEDYDQGNDDCKNKNGDRFRNGVKEDTTDSGSGATVTPMSEMKSGEPGCDVKQESNSEEKEVNGSSSGILL